MGDLRADSGQMLDEFIGAELVRRTRDTRRSSGAQRIHANMNNYSNYFPN
jgi:hypothetical protein